MKEILMNPKITNLKGSFSIPFFQLLAGKIKLPEELLLQSQAIQAMEVSDPERDIQLKELQEKLGKDMQNLLKDFGVVLPTEGVTLNLSLASLLCDLYRQGDTVPTTPLLARTYEKRMQERLAIYERGDFHVDDLFKSKIKKTLSDSKLWENLQIRCWFAVGNDRRMLLMTHNILSMVPQLFEAVMQLFPDESNAVSS